MEYGTTAHNKRYTLRRHSAAPGFQSARSFRYARILRAGGDDPVRGKINL